MTFLSAGTPVQVGTPVEGHAETPLQDNLAIVALAMSLGKIPPCKEDKPGEQLRPLVHKDELQHGRIVALEGLLGDGRGTRCGLRAP